MAKKNQGTAMLVFGVLAVLVLAMIFGGVPGSISGRATEESVETSEEAQEAIEFAEKGTLRVEDPKYPSGSNPSSGTIYAIFDDPSGIDNWADTDGFETGDLNNYKSATNDGSVDFDNLDLQDVKALYIDATATTEYDLFVEMTLDVLKNNFDNNGFDFKGSIINLGQPVKGTPTASMVCIDEDNKQSTDNNKIGVLTTASNETGKDYDCEVTFRTPKTGVAVVDQIQINDTDVSSEGLEKLQYEGKTIYTTTTDPYLFSSSKAYTDDADSNEIGLFEPKAILTKTTWDVGVILDKDAFVMDADTQFDLEFDVRATVGNDSLFQAGNSKLETNEPLFNMWLKHDDSVVKYHQVKG